MQEPVAIEREAHQRLPLLLADLLGEPVDAVAFEREPDDRQIDARAEIGRQSWVFEIRHQAGLGSSISPHGNCTTSMRGARLLC
jgi:hypothetical protein